ncbi:MAG: ABC transporter substrate-binding protein, partial [Thermomicrobiales bacterium]
ARTVELSRRRFLGAAAGLAGAAALPASRWSVASAQDGEPKPGGTLYIGQDFGPQDLDPNKTIAWASTNVEELIYTGLLRWTPTMEVEPDLATAYEMVDDLTYVFTLREGVTFHNDAPFSAEDVKYTFERILDPATASPHASIYSVVSAIEVVDPLTVKFTLSQPFAPLLRYLATIPYGAIVPKGATDELSTAPVGTGPFVFQEHLLDQEVRLSRFEGYYEDGLPYVDEVVFQLLGDDTSISSALRSETVQLTWLKDPRVAQNVAKTDEGLASTPGVSSRYLPILFDLSAPPFDDVRVRRAMSLALDRQAIVDTVLAGYGSVGAFLPPSQLGGYTGDGSDLPYYTRDVEGAKALLAEAGHDGLDVPEFKIVAANQLDVQCAQVMKEQWAEAGINVEINPMEVGAILDDWSSGTYQMATVGTVWTPDPNQEVDRFHSATSFRVVKGIADAALDQLIEQGRTEADEATRIEIYGQIQQHILDNVYVIVPYTYPLRWELLWDYVKGYEVMPSNARLTVRKTWLDQ